MPLFRAQLEQNPMSFQKAMEIVQALAGQKMREYHAAVGAGLIRPEPVELEREITQAMLVFEEHRKEIAELTPIHVTL